MFRKLLVFIPAACLVLALASCGGGGGGGNSGYTVYYTTPEGSFPGGRVECGNAGIGYGSFWFNGDNNDTHAFAWQGSTASKLDLNPEGFYRSAITGTDGKQLVGIGTLYAEVAETHGIIWDVATQQATDVFPAGFTAVSLHGVDNGYQVGSGNSNTFSGHPLVFHGPNSYVDLMPNGWLSGDATSISGNVIGGTMIKNGPDDWHAAMWSTHDAASFIDLHSDMFTYTELTCVSGNEQVGSGNLMQDGFTVGHALLWKGSAASMIDLNPPGGYGSAANGVNHGVQVGAYYLESDSNTEKACYWKGTAASRVDLDHYIDIPHMASTAFAIDSHGTIYGFVFPSPTSWYGVMWVPK